MVSNTPLSYMVSVTSLFENQPYHDLLFVLIQVVVVQIRNIDVQISGGEKGHGVVPVLRLEPVVESVDEESVEEEDSLKVSQVVGIFAPTKKARPA